jgi:S-adenosylmethionine synthetase
MTKTKNLKAFELVLIGHPDKVCDLVSKTVCDANKGGRNAIECCWGNQLFIVNGETDKKWKADEVETLVRNILTNDIGLTPEEMRSIVIMNNLNIQSSEINDIVGESGTGDNGIYFGGYHKVYSPVIRRMKDMCAALTAPVLREWGYRTDGKFIFNMDTKGNVTDLTINCASFENVVFGPNRVALESFIHTFTGSGTTVIINPKGDWHKCHGFADCGLTGRKLACDGSCGLFSHGGGAMFGKDISKADVTVPLFLEHLAKENIGRKKVCGFSAWSIIGDTNLEVFKDGKRFGVIPYSEMKEYVADKELNLFGVLK